MSLICPVDGAVGIGVELESRFLAELDFGNVVLVDIAENPDGGEIGDGEGRGGSGESYARSRSVGHVLRDDDAGDGRVDIDDGAGMILVDAQNISTALRRR